MTKLSPYQSDLFSTRGEQMLAALFLRQAAQMGEQKMTTSGAVNGPSAGRVLLADALELAGGYVGEDRAHDHAQIAKFLALFDLPFEENGSPLSFCAAGFGWCVVKAYANRMGIAYTADDAVAKFHGLLSAVQREYLLLDPRCHIMIADAKTRGTWRAGLAGAQEGDPVFFCFNGTNVAEHVGLFRSAGAGKVNSRDFNTSNASNANGGAVEDKTRDGHFVVGHISLG